MTPGLHLHDVEVHSRSKYFWLTANLLCLIMPLSVRGRADESSTSRLPRQTFHSRDKHEVMRGCHAVSRVRQGRVLETPAIETNSDTKRSEARWRKDRHRAQKKLKRM